MKSTRSQIRSEVEQLELRESKPRQEIWRLENDPAYREKIAREQRGYHAPGKHVYHIREVRSREP